MSAPKPPLSEALAELRAIVDGDDIDPAPLSVGDDLLVLAERDDLRAQVAALAAERDRLRALVREQVSCECSNDDACRFVRERDEARAERDRLARVLACEVGDEGAAPDGWKVTVDGWRKSLSETLAIEADARPWAYKHRWMLHENNDGYINNGQKYDTALEAMLAADEAARAGEVADKPDT